MNTDGIHSAQTASVLHWFCALMPTYPHVQKQAQDELDRVIGRDRLPSICDEARLPYIHAILKEVRAVTLKQESNHDHL